MSPLFAPKRPSRCCDIVLYLAISSGKATGGKRPGPRAALRQRVTERQRESRDPRRGAEARGVLDGGRPWAAEFSGGEDGRQTVGVGNGRFALFAGRIRAGE